ncbi:histone-lysine N-methyltransferase 2B isoform X3 [Pangasianodon hypophthalmus]|uniref:histone-lysine N-methyltransferase 2B isoform X3 n=1 Tax=Pangasianodon hypophthalmus TaxID=310915 RepID=UPI0023075CD2|nr:histone-lysine N-methyltransferase 2B isoform X3 [Pangasianodon hypophthalmus]
MAAAGGGLPASVVFAGASPSAPARCRFPGRPGPSRSRQKTGKRWRVGRLRLEEEAAAAAVEAVASGPRAPRPVSVELNLREDPTLLRVLRLSERLARQKDAGFCTSGSDEEGDFTGFQTDGRWALRSGQDVTQKSSVKSSSSSKEKSCPAHDPSANNKVTTAKKGLRVTTETEREPPSEKREKKGGKLQQNVGKPKLVVKLATKEMTNKNLPRETTLRRGRGKPSEKEKGTKFSHEEENGGVEEEVLDEPAADAGRKETRQGRTSQSRQRKFVWNLTLIKRRGRSSKKVLAENLGRRSRREYARTAEPQGKAQEEATRDELAIDQDASVSPKPVAKQKKVRNVTSASPKEEEQENAVSPDGSEGTPVKGSSPHSPKLSPRALKRRKSLFGYRRKPEQESLLKMKKAQSQAASRIPRKRRRLVCYTYEAVESPANQEQSQEPPAQVASQQGLTDSVISSRPSRVIRVPKRFMDDEGMSGLLGKKAVQTENQEDESCSDTEEANLSQTPRLGSKQKSANKRTICDNEEDFVAKSEEWKPGSLTGGPRKKVGRPAYDATPLKIYESLKMLTASLAQRKEQRMASARFKALGEKVECESHGEVESPASRELRKWGSSDIKIGDLNCPGVVHKVAIHADDQVISQSALSSVEELETKAEVERTSLEDATDLQSTDAGKSEVVLAQGSSFHKVNISGANKRMLHLLKRAKVQLIKIDQQKQMKTAQGLPVGGPRIKHVCRAAAVALGQPRAMVPEDIPRLSALPLHEREGIAPSQDTEDLGSHSEPESTGSVEQRPVYKQKAFGLRQRRCFNCKGCCREEDCGTCVFCLDKPKYGGPNKKRQSCIYRKCLRIEENKMRRMKVQMKRRAMYAQATAYSGGEEEGEGDGTGDALSTNALSSIRRQPRRQVTRRCFSDLLESDSTDTEASGEDVAKEQSSSEPSIKANDTVTHPDVEDEAVKPRRPGLPRGLWGRRRINKLQSCPASQALERSAPGSPSVKLRLKFQLRLHRLPLSMVRAAEVSSVAVPSQPDDKKAQEEEADRETRVVKEGALQQPLTDPCLPHSQSSMEHTPPSVLATLAKGFAHRERQAQEPAHKIRVDFKEDCNIQNVWAMGGLSILTSLPITAECVCLLCASKGHHNMIFCQMCCEPFHRFCLPVDDRPQNENLQNWCCRRCKFCHVCGRKGKQGKPVLQCRRCFYCYHPSCLGPTYPKPGKCSTPWVCMLCIRCKSCGVTPGKSWGAAWNHELDLCPDCSNLHKQGNFCTVCLKCYPEHEFDMKMMQCARCAHWVHPKCEGLTDDLHEILKRLRGKSLVFSCAACSKNFPSGWQEVVQSVLRNGLEKIMNGLMSSLTTHHLQKCSECEACSDADSIKSRKVVCDLHAVERKLEEGLYTSLKAFHEDVVTVLVKQLEQEESLPEEQRPTAQARALYIKLLEQTFTWFNSQDPKAWKPVMKEFPSGMLPEAIIPPSEEHSYAQWLEEHDHATANENEENLHLKAQGKEPQSISRCGVDERHCSLCQQQGDAKPTDAGRLLYLGQNEWAHVNCCIWSAEVQEVRGALLHVHSAVARGRFMRCERCSQAGATVGCCLSSCQSNYHFMCARASHCVFQSDKKVYCYKHRDLVSNKVMNGFEVLRRVYVDFEGINLRRKFLTGLEPESINVMIGSLKIHRLGVLTELSANAGKLYPVGYQCTRWYWSTVDPRKPCKYTCRVTDIQPSSPRKTPHLARNQEENCTIAHSPKQHEDMDTTEADLAMKLTPSTPSPNSKLDSGTGSKTTGHPHNRRPAGGTFRPLPSPGTAVSSSHHILTISDLDETRRSRRLSLRSRNASPPHTSPSGPVKLCTGAGLHPRSLPFSSPVSPLGSHENPLSSLSPRRRGRPPSSPSGATSAYSPRQGAVASPPSTFVLSPCHSPKIQQHLKVTPQESAEVPQDFSASLEPEDAAGMPEERISMIAVMNDGDTMPLSSDQELLSTQFDTDTDVAVASVLNEKLEFDEALLNENVALHFGQHGSGAEVAEQGQGLLTEGNGLVDENLVSGAGASRYSSRIKDFSGLSAAEEQLEQESTNEGSDHYFNFSRTVVVCDSAQTGLTLLPTSQSISQLDGADNNSESDAGEASGEDNTQDVGNSYHSQDTSKGTASVGGHSGSRLVCTGKAESFVTESVHMDDEPNILEKFQGSAFLQKSGDMIVDSVAEVFAPQEGTSVKDLMVQEMQLTPEADVQDVVLSPPMFDTSSDLLAGHEDILMDSAPLDHLNEVVLDPASDDFVSAQDGSLVNICDSSALGSLEKDPEQIALSEPPPMSSVGKVRIITSGPAPHRSFIIPQPVTHHRVVNMAVPTVTSLPMSLSVNNVSTLPALSVFPQRNHVVTSSPVVINGPDSQLKDATKGRPLAIRLPTSTKTSVTGALSSPQVLLVNRSGQILIKDPQTNSYQIPSASSPSYSQISQIAKIIHSHNLVHRAVPRVLVTPVPQTSPSQGPTTHVVSYTNGAAPSTKVLIRRLPQKSSAVQMSSGSIPMRGTSGVKLKNVSVPSTPVLERIQGEDAQAIIERAMASHRDMTNPHALSPSHFQVHPYLNKLQSPESTDVVKQFTGLHRQTKPNILSHSRPQVRVKRVSSVSERTVVKQCKTTSTEPTVLSSQDELNRSLGVRIKAPSIKEVLHFNQPEVENLCEPKSNEAKELEIERSIPKECEPCELQESESNHDKNHVWVSSRNSDLSDWGPCSGWSSDEDSSSPFKNEQDGCSSQDKPHLLFKITSDDGFSVEADSIEVAWKAVVDGVQEARTGYRLEQLPLGRMSGARVLGVLHDAVLFLLEQLQGASQCYNHRFRFHQQEKAEEELPINPSGCARAEVYTRKNTFDMFNFLASQHRQLPESRPCDEDEDDVKLKCSRRATSMELPMAMRFRHLEKTSKEAVGVYRSAIHGRGLFCKRNIEAGEMVIEYAGNVIRSVLTDKRENYYSSKGIGCYMFRIDDFDVVDATMHGNAARFINHSCEPNCYSRVINVEGQKHIVIFALRKIYRGEELTYDYKFPIEDASNKLHCNCGARRCRRFLN